MVMPPPPPMAPVPGRPPGTHVQELAARPGARHRRPSSVVRRRAGAWVDLVVLASRDDQRLGDMAAGTYVVRTKDLETSAYGAPSRIG